jgi:hypothetical protein
MALGNLAALLNRPAALVVVEQMRKLYMRLYPYATIDFAHIGDVNKSLAQLDAKITALSDLLTAHVHPVVEGVPATGIPIISAPVLPPTVLTNDVALSLVVLPGVPQPTGEATPAVLPCRVGPPTEIVAIPPLSPADITGTGIV